MKHGIAAALLLGLLCLSGCAPTTVVYYGDDILPQPPQSETEQEGEDKEKEAVKTGLAVLTDISGSESGVKADGEVTVVALTVDDGGIIRSCIIDGISTQLTFDDDGELTGDITAPVQTKNELGEAYGMKHYGGARYEWDQQAAALSRYAVGKTAEQLRISAIDDNGYALDADLATTATIYLGGLVDAIEQAAVSARHCGARLGDALRLAVIADWSESTGADDEKEGRARLKCDIAALTLDALTITSCRIDSVQADVTFNDDGELTGDITAPVKTKNELGEAYGMKRYGGAKYEWNEQAANFAAYVTGKTAAQVAGIAVEGGKAAEADLAATVTISIAPFQSLIAKACG